MMAKRDLIVFGEDWGGLPSSTQHLIKCLSYDRKVLWINSIGLRCPKFTWCDIKRILIKLIRFTLSRSATIEQSETSNMCIVNPITLPAPKNRWLRKLAAFLLKQQIQPKINRLGLVDPVVWSSLPTAIDVIEKLDIHRVVYYCGDDFSGLAGVDHDTVTEHECELVEKSDLIITASEELKKRFFHKKVRTLVHGVHFDLFNNSTQKAEDFPSNGNPVAGFYGSLSEWLDVELLKTTIQLLPHWDFVFIGQEVADMSPLKELDNTFFVGPRPHQELPRYSQHWNVSLLPFKDTPQIRACNPLKLVEYLATGNPIVATPFPAIGRYAGIIQQARTAKCFAYALEASLSVRKVPHFSHVLRKSVEKNTWQYKADQVSRWLEAL